MRIFIATDIHVSKMGTEYFVSSKVYTIFKRYAESFGEIVICARIDEVDEVDNELQNASEYIKDSVSLGGLLSGLLGKNSKQIEAKITQCDLVIARLPSISGCRAADIAKRHKIPYMAEVMGCAWDAYWNHGLIGKGIAPYMFLKMKKAVHNADFALYVTNVFLQHRYPTMGKQIGCSDVVLQDHSEDVLEKRLDKIKNRINETIIIGTVGAVNVPYKGQKYVIQALGDLKKTGITNIVYCLVGGGDEKRLKNVARKCNVSNQVKFLGVIPHEKIYDWLDSLDVYIQPSSAEGLPRALIEAMSRGLPALGTNVGGIPELLDSQCIINKKKKNKKEIATKLIALINQTMTEQAKRNYNESQKYTNQNLNKKRIAFFEQLFIDSNLRNSFYRDNLS